ncbi:DUF72 domain-containing protein [Nostoc sp.]|uniref:DUF72 domain-containing protein n=1 Tax=Nostoc sp. TaxID=1180 RepID=UPI002FF50EDE
MAGFISIEWIFFIHHICLAISNYHFIPNILLLWNVGYSDAELPTWVEHIRSFLMQEIDVYVYFNNDLDGNAIDDAQRLYSLLGSC